MSRDQLQSMLDELLADAGASMRAAAAREHRDESRAAAATTAAAIPPDGTLTDVEQLRELSDEALCKVLATSPRDDLLTVLSGASDGLRRRILTNLAPESVKWLQQNLAYFDEPTRALLAEGRAHVLAQANKLLRAGTIARPAPKSASAAGSAGASANADDEEIERLGATVAELLDLLHDRGAAALSNVVSARHPLLDEAVQRVARGEGEASVAAAVQARKAALLASFARKLEVAAEGALALARGDDADSFRRRLPTIGS